MCPKPETLCGSAQPAAADQSGAVEQTTISGESDEGHMLWDRLGIAGSLLCIAHCAFTPLLIGYLSVVGLGLPGGDLIHKIITFPLLIIAVLAFWPGYRRHQNIKILAAGAAGALTLLMAVFILEPLLSHHMETGLTVAGSILLIGAHTANWRLADSCCDDA